ncbi:MAG: hypothetical protein RIC35_24955 [Marinoscillum sp.]
MSILQRSLPIVCMVFLALPALSMGSAETPSAFNGILGILELPFLAMAVVFSFMTAKALKGGKLGRGMSFLAWGFLVMAVGHLHMQMDYHFGFNLFEDILGNIGGMVAWFIALIVTWGLSGYGFYLIWKVSKS